MELKVTPYKKNKNGSFSAKERLILTMIDYFQVVNEDFENSHLWNKIKLILLVYYLYDKDLESNLDYVIKYSTLFTPPPNDLEIIKQDFQTIVRKIKSGKAHELSEGDTIYLGAVTKSATSSNRRKQPFSEELAKPRAFSFKTSYMSYVLNNYVMGKKKTYEPIISSIFDNEQDNINEQILPNTIYNSFEEYVVSKIGYHEGKSIESLCEEFDIKFDKKPKNLESIIAYRILGIKGNKAEEFIKANIAVKAIRIGKTNTIKEHMSFPTFKFKELIEESWEESKFGNYLRETRFFFIVYKYDNDNVLRLKGCQFWNIPYDDLENDVKCVWEKTKKVLLEGVKITSKNGKNHNNLPKAKENRVSHVRPHAQNSKDTYELPDGRDLVKQCFWLNNTYIYDQLDEKLKS